jgi:F0F1-type ATP synthase membrane subunit b/b'
MPADPEQKAREEVREAQARYERERDKAREARSRAFAKAQKTGLSLRQIGEEVGLHHSRVADIIHGE